MIDIICMSIDVKLRQLSGSSVGELFRLLANLLLLFGSDLAVQIFPKLLADIPRPK